MSRRKMSDHTHQQGDQYLVTGFYAYSSERFRPIRTDNPFYAMNINLWKGTVYQLRDGKRTTIKRVL